MPDRFSKNPQTEAVIQHLENADKLQGVPHSGKHAVTEAAGGIGHQNQPEPKALGLGGTAWVSLAMLVLLGIVVWRGGVRAIGAGLDKQIAGIREQLEQARTLRAEAEQLRDDYARRIADAERGAHDMIAHAEQEADALVAKAHRDAADLVERRARMAEDKIAAAERAALAEVRSRAAATAVAAAQSLIVARMDAGADRTAVNRAIAGLGRLN